MKLAEKVEIFDVSFVDTECFKVISEDLAKLEQCVVPSIPCIPEQKCSGTPDVMPIIKVLQET